jgi:hypothetical protein
VTKVGLKEHNFDVEWPLIQCIVSSLRMVVMLNVNSSWMVISDDSASSYAPQQEILKPGSEAVSQ